MAQKKEGGECKKQIPAPPMWNGKFKVTGNPLFVIPMILGYEPVDESMSLYQGDSSKFLLIPVTATAVVYKDGWILLDTGFNTDIANDDEKRSRHFKMQKNYTPIVQLRPAEPLTDQIKSFNLDMGKLVGCALSHTHSDITGGLHLLPAGIPVVLQKNEFNWITSFKDIDEGLNQFVIITDVLDKVKDIHLLEGETEIAPGLQTLDTKGHTPGHQSFKITLTDCTVVLACCGADLRRNINERIPPGLVPDESWRQLTYEAINKLADLELNAKKEGKQLQVWPGHDTTWWVWRGIMTGEVERRITSGIYEKEVLDVQRNLAKAQQHYDDVQRKLYINVAGKFPL